MKPAIEPVIRILPWPARAHVAADLLDQIDRAGDVGVDDVADLVEILVEKAVAEAAPGICDQEFDRAPVLAARIVELVDAFDRGEVSLDSLELLPRRPQGTAAASSISGSSAAMTRS